MTRSHTIAPVFWASVAACFLASAGDVGGQDGDVKRELQLLREENQALRGQVQKQQVVIDSLSVTVAEIQKASSQRGRELEDLKTAVEQPESGSAPSHGFSFGRVNFSGEGGVGFFDTGSEGTFPNNEFRVDEAKLFIEAPVWEDVYTFAELNFASREADEVDLDLGELYLDFENVSKLWGRDRWVNVRAGRIDIPFGEEYLTRDAIDNPLISHSLVDLWGVDEGVELYGTIGKVSYAVAVQNGGVPVARDFDSDKSVAGRLSVDPAPWLHLSVSGMRTGDLNAENDGLSEMWFGGGWFIALDPDETTEFHANLVEGDVTIRLPRGHISGFVGYVHYGDNDASGSNRRDVYYYSVEAVHDLTRKFYAAARFSQIFADDGFPIVGYGDMGAYLFRGAPVLSDDIWRLSLGLGCRLSRHLVIKTEYSFEQRELSYESQHSDEHFLAAEAAFGF